MKKLFLLILPLYLQYFVSAQGRILHIPDLPGYVTIKCDLHMHTMFSDGDVWPTVRVDEAVRDGLDAIAITDHLEYNPHKNFVPLDLNAAWKIAEAYAKERNLILVHGTEITRSMPPGHMNALFITDAGALAVDSAWDAYAAAIKQGAFLMYNHPGWDRQQPDSVPRIYEIHKRLLKNGWLHGVEIYNDASYYPLVHDWGKQYNLTLLGCSDVHGIISERYNKDYYTSRPMTLVFAKERRSESLKEALFAGRTLVWFSNKIAGKEEYARPFFNQCVSVSKPFYETNRSTYSQVTNSSDIPFYLVSEDGSSFITLPPNSVTRLVTGKKSNATVYKVTNVLTGKDEVLKVKLEPGGREQ
jgi:hypothetical protein